ALANAITILNAIRARGNQPAMDPASTQPQVLAEVVEQRRRELFLESHHLGDAIRFGITLTPASGTAYPGGGTYGTSKCMPLPDVERINNPNI
ncbi:MAG TPA: RagB/SusD family nutrient uptake outer membrane protein, partial [Longimicrobium sp.]|nr:RagB/SusD family nutrient uptake outer membrane protein [Longimicrobium sp.]